MGSDMKFARWALGSYIIFLTAWGVSQMAFPDWEGGWGVARCLFWGIVYLGIAGTALPLYIARKFDLAMSDPDVPAKRFIIGTAALLIAVGVGVFMSGSFDRVMEIRPPAAVVLKYLLLFAPMAAALTLHCLFLVPAAVTGALGGHNGAMSLAIVVSALSMGLGFLVDARFDSTENAVTMTVLGLLFGTGAVLTRSVSLTAFVFFLVMLSNTLAEGKYNDYPWYAAATGFVLCALFLLAASAGGFYRKKNAGS